MFLWRSYFAADYAVKTIKWSSTDTVRLHVSTALRISIVCTNLVTIAWHNYTEITLHFIGHSECSCI